MNVKTHRTLKKILSSTPTSTPLSRKKLQVSKPQGKFDHLFQCPLTPQTFLLPVLIKLPIRVIWTSSYPPVRVLRSEKGLVPLCIIPLSLSLSHTYTQPHRELYLALTPGKSVPGVCCLVSRPGHAVSTKPDGATCPSKSHHSE